jgi:hypothetical protein
MLQEVLAHFFKAMMKSELVISSPSTKNVTNLSQRVGGVWDWLINVIQLNKPRTQLHYQLQQMNPFFQSTTCSDAFALNLSYVMLLLCKPFLEKNESQSSIQLEMLCDSQMLGIDLTTETKLSPPNVVPQSTSTSHSSSSSVTLTTPSLSSVTAPLDNSLHLNRDESVDLRSDGSCSSWNESNNVRSQTSNEFLSNDSHASYNLYETNSQSQTMQLSPDTESESKHPSFVSHVLPSNPKKGVFVSRMFFLTHAVLHVCTIPTIESYARFNQQLARLRERSNLLQHSMQSITNPLQRQVTFAILSLSLSLSLFIPSLHFVLSSDTFKLFCSRFYFVWRLHRF